MQLATRSRARTRTGSWLLLYASPLSGQPAGRTAVVIQPAAASEVAPLVALARGELVGQVFRQHYLPRWENLDQPPTGWHGYAER